MQGFTQERCGSCIKNGFAQMSNIQMMPSSITIPLQHPDVSFDWGDDDNDFDMDTAGDVAAKDYHGYWL